MKIKEVYDFLDSFAPYNTQCEWDNSGFMCGNPCDEADSIMLCLDCTDDVIEQAVRNNCKLIVCHHPLIFSPVRRVYSDSVLYNAIKNGITVISAHTNLDMAQGGVNDVLCEKLAFDDVQPLYAEGVPLLRMGKTKECNAQSFASFVSERLGIAAQVHDSGRNVGKVAVCGGAGGEYIKEAFDAGCDTYVTGEAKHHEFLEAKKLGINLIVAGHFSTEVPVLESLCDRLLKAFPGHKVCVAYEECPYKTVI